MTNKTENRHKLKLEIEYYSKANNGYQAYEEIDKLLLKHGYKITKYEHKIIN